MTKSKQTYRALRGVENKKGERYEAGEVIPANAFPAAVIANWLERGILEAEQEQDDGSDPVGQG